MFESLFRRKSKAPAVKKRAKPQRELLAIDGEKVAVNVRFNPRARRIVMRIHPITGEVTVTAPPRTGMVEAMAFARGEAAWISDQRGAVPSPVAFAPGAIVPFGGVPHRIASSVHKGPAPVWREAGQIFVSGKPEHVSRRLTDFFKREAKKAMETRAVELGAQIGVRPARVTVRDTATRWGSCSSSRSLSFSWRLVFAPEFVRDYVVAHEVAHLKEMNHGPKFWAHVRALNPDDKKARRWLREHGRGLLRYN
jgi:predicted metal-dependent hydrolase